MMKHLVNSDRNRRIVPQHGLGKRVTHENQFDARFVHQARGGVVVGGQARNLFAPQLPFEDRRER